MTDFAPPVATDGLVAAVADADAASTTTSVVVRAAADRRRRSLPASRTSFAFKSSPMYASLPDCQLRVHPLTSNPPRAPEVRPSESII